MKQKDLLFLLISSFILTVAWIGFSLYHSYADSTVSSEEQAQIVPISPDFDSKVLEEIKKREKVEPLYQLKASGSSSTSATPTITAVPPTPSVSASPSGDVVPAP